jgi:hypothetical protein
MYREEKIRNIGGSGTISEAKVVRKTAHQEILIIKLNILMVGDTALRWSTGGEQLHFKLGQAGTNVKHCPV